MILVDTSVLSLALRRKRHQLSAVELSACRLLESAIAAHQVELLGAVRLEVLSGIREESQFERVRGALRAFRDVPLLLDDYETAAQMSNRCRAGGISGGLVDFLICAVTVRRNWRILTSDQDFELYLKHLPLQLMIPKPFPRPS